MQVFSIGQDHVALLKCLRYRRNTLQSVFALKTSFEYIFYTRALQYVTPRTVFALKTCDPLC